MYGKWFYLRNNVYYRLVSTEKYKRHHRLREEVSELHQGEVGASSLALLPETDLSAVFNDIEDSLRYKYMHKSQLKVKAKWFGGGL